MSDPRTACVWISNLALKLFCIYNPQPSSCVVVLKRVILPLNLSADINVIRL